MPITFVRTDEGKKATLRLAGTLDVSTADQLRAPTEQLVEDVSARLKAEPDQRPDVEIDLAGVTLIDSSGVGALVGLYKRLKAIGCNMKVVNVSNQPLSIFTLLRLNKVFMS